MSFGYQIGQCRLAVDDDKTRNFYRTLPEITQNCACGDCKYFQTVVIYKRIRLFEILKAMGVDLSRQPDINPDGVCSIGPTEKFSKGYLGYYIVFAKIGKTQRQPQSKDSHGHIRQVKFFDAEEDSYVEYDIIQEAIDQIKINFYLQCEKI